MAAIRSSDHCHQSQPTAIAATFFLPFYFFLIFASCRRGLQQLAAHRQLPATAIFFRSAAISRPPAILRLAAILPTTCTTY
ncbi:hypothetical protein MRB53_010088 [Persea americana]|uniref:Uncharacterized protein n=1 Tax=Persea americana TaxID=3435 RepID=A0ACC2LQY0_PERAE|nr:hypothetical protein MRB53_010088 [Persea americana]